jgi:hypothetical protein
MMIEGFKVLMFVSSEMFFKVFNSLTQTQKAHQLSMQKEEEEATTFFHHHNIHCFNKVVENDDDFFNIQKWKKVFNLSCSFCQIFLIIIIMFDAYVYVLLKISSLFVNFYIFFSSFK